MINSAVVVIQLYCAHFLQQQKKIHIFVVRLLKSTVYTVKSWSCHVFIWWSCDHSTRALVGFVLQITMWQRNNSTAVDIFMANILFISPFYAFVFYADTHFNTLCPRKWFSLYFICAFCFTFLYFFSAPHCLSALCHFAPARQLKEQTLILYIISCIAVSMWGMSLLLFCLVCCTVIKHTGS